MNKGSSEARPGCGEELCSAKLWAAEARSSWGWKTLNMQEDQP